MTRTPQYAQLDGNEAAARIAHLLSEVCIIYPITPSSPMGEHADQWSNQGRTNLWGMVPDVVEMQSEGGAAGAVHGALQAGALTTTFTASQGLLLMLPNMYKIAGELTAAVFHVAARSIAAQALSIFGDHQDVMAARSTGWAMLSSASVQEAQDLALVAHAATLQTRLPFLHFFDGFRTSHEINKIELIGPDVVRAMISDDLVRAHRDRGLDPDRPVIRGTAQNPDVYFQAREAANPFYAETPAAVEAAMDRLAELVGRRYRLFDYSGHPEPDRVVILMGSGAGAAKEAIGALTAAGERVGLLQVRLYRPWSARHFLTALPASVQGIVVLDRTKEPGAVGEPLYQDVVTTLASAAASAGRPLPRVIGGRYGLSSKEFTPAMVKACLDEVARPAPRSGFTVGIDDDVSGTSLDVDPTFRVAHEGVTQAVFFGLGSDGTVGANKNSIKIIGEETDFFTQGYFVYDSKKSGSRTISHLRFGPKPIESTYLIESANFVACHSFRFLEQIDVLDVAAEGATVLLNSPHGAEAVWDQLPGSVQQAVLTKRLRLFVIDAEAVARGAGMGRRINTVMQTCFFAISGVLPRDEAIAKIKKAIEKTYGAKGEEVVAKNFAAVDQTLAHLAEVPVPEAPSRDDRLALPVAPGAPPFVQQVTAMMLAGKGDALPVSKLPVDGTYPTATARYEKRSISTYIPAWEPDLCIQCGNCSYVCPHACIRVTHAAAKDLDGAPASVLHAPLEGRGFPEQRYLLQVYPDDCTGCSLCVEACPVRDVTRGGQRAINMAEKEPRLEGDRQSVAFFESLPVADRTQVDFSKVRGVQYLEPLFEFSGACAGCGETPYLKLLTQLFGERLLVANATGCSSIYGGNLPTTPWSQNGAGRGPAWSNSLFEDNAEFGLGFRVAGDHLVERARTLLAEEAARADGVVDSPSADALLNASQRTESELAAQRARVEAVIAALGDRDDGAARELRGVLGKLVRRSVWLVGGDGWAYDIGYGGLDHVLASGRNVNVLVLDTEVYSNTGGQASKSTPTAAVAKFAAGGKEGAKKDLALMAIAYNNVYVARVALGANPQQTLLAFREAEAYPGPSLILAYSPCIAHGINLQHGLRQQQLAVKSGHWPLLRYNPELAAEGDNPMALDSPRPRIDLREYAYNELRYRMLKHTKPERAAELLAAAEAALEKRWNVYEYLASGKGA